MGGKVTASLNRKEQERFLTNHGFSFVREDGKHQMWEHRKFNALASKHNLHIPLNFLCARGTATQTATIGLPHTASFGTWHRISKLAEWCQEAVTRFPDLQQAAGNAPARHQGQPWKPPSRPF